MDRDLGFLLTARRARAETRSKNSWGGAMLNRVARAFVALLAGVAVLAFADDGPSGQFEILTLSNRADLISGGDALVEVRVPKQVGLDDVVITLNGRDITAAFTRDTAARSFRGLVTGLADGRNRLEAGAREQHGSAHAGKLEITNHPIGGPVLLGSQTQPWVCATPAPTIDPATGALTQASGLTTSAIDAQCNIATEFHLFYRTKTA